MQGISKTVVLAAILALGGPALAQTPGAAPAQGASPAAPAQGEAKSICKMEYVTGSRVKKQKVCRDAATGKATERDQDNLRRFQNRSGDTQPVLPGGAG
jgi:hypothetical protein